MKLKTNTKSAVDVSSDDGITIALCYDSQVSLQMVNSKLVKFSKTELFP